MQHAKQLTCDAASVCMKKFVLFPNDSTIWEEEEDGGMIDTMMISLFQLSDPYAPIQDS